MRALVWLFFALAIGVSASAFGGAAHVLFNVYGPTIEPACPVCPDVPRVFMP